MAQAQFQNNWQHLQERLAKTWQKAFPFLQGQSTPAMPDYLSWWQEFAGQSGEGHVADGVATVMRQWSALGELLTRQWTEQGAKFDPQSWARQMAEQMQSLSAFRNPVAETLKQVAEQGAKGFEEMFAEFSAYAQPFKQELAGTFALPAFGYNRENQERHQRLGKAMLDYQEQMGAYHALIAKASQIGFGIFEKKSAELAQSGTPGSLRAYYDAFIDAMEDGYAQIALSPEFRETYGALVDAQMKVRSGVQREVEQWCGALGMPTRTELNGAHQKIMDLRRQIARLEERLADTRAPQQQRQAAPAPAAAPPSKKTAARPASNTKSAPSKQTRAKKAVPTKKAKAARRK